MHLLFTEKLCDSYSYYLPFIAKEMWPKRSWVAWTRSHNYENQAEILTHSLFSHVLLCLTSSGTQAGTALYILLCTFHFYSVTSAYIRISLISLSSIAMLYFVLEFRLSSHFCLDFCMTCSISSISNLFYIDIRMTFMTCLHN